MSGSCLVAVVMGSKSDWSTMHHALDLLRQFEIKSEAKVISAHRTPDLNSPTWTYWQNRWDTLVVYFVGDKVDRIAR